jgi:hypothetical protein
MWQIHGDWPIAVKWQDKDQGTSKDSRRGLVIDRSTSGGSETHLGQGLENASDRFCYLLCQTLDCAAQAIATMAELDNVCRGNHQSPKTNRAKETNTSANQPAGAGNAGCSRWCSSMVKYRTQASRYRQLSGLKITGATVKTDRLPSLIAACMNWDFAPFASHGPKVYISVQGYDQNRHHNLPPTPSFDCIRHRLNNFCWNHLTKKESEAIPSICLCRFVLSSLETPTSLYCSWSPRITTLTDSHRKLDGSCQCGGVEFTLQSQTPVPYQLCACSICRKVGGYPGSVNLGGIADSLKVLKGQDLIKCVQPLPTTNQHPSYDR